MSQHTPTHNSSLEMIPDLQRAMTPETKVNQIIYSSFPVSWPNFKSLTQTHFVIYCWQDFILIFQRDITPGRGITRTRKKYRSAIFPWWIRIINIISKLACTVRKIWQASKSMAHARTTTKQLLLSWGHKYRQGVPRRVRPKRRLLAPLDDCTCAFEEWVYGWRKVP